MRTLWLSSAALIVSAHFAWAQTTAAPSPMGPANAPTETSPGMSPGGTASPPSMAQPPNSGAMPNSAMPNGSMSNGSMSTGSAMNPSSGMAPGGSNHMNMTHMPANASAASYLQIAQYATQHHNKARADEALSRAETRLLTRSVPQTSVASPDQSPAIMAITQARQALRAGDFNQASAEIDTAMQHAPASSMAPGGMANPGSSMGSPASNTSPGGMNR